MSEMLDSKSLLNEKRGQTIKVLAILSWIYIGIFGLLTLFGVFGGPLSPDEIENQKLRVYEQTTDEVIAVFGKEFPLENISIIEISNEKFYSINGLSLANFVLGAYAVFLMFNLKKRGYYLYVLYSIVPVASQIAYFGTGTMSTFMYVFLAIFSGLFCLLYGLQTKRMS